MSIRRTTTKKLPVGEKRNENAKKLYEEMKTATKKA
jgi:hypothetical protein